MSAPLSGSLTWEILLYAGAVWRGEEGQGSVAVLGSSAMFDDSNLGTHSNVVLLAWVLDCLLNQVCGAQ